MGCKPKKKNRCKSKKQPTEFDGQVNITTLDPSKLKETGYVQYFYHSPSSKLPIRDVLNEHRKGHKTEPHIEIGAENYICECYQRNIKELADSKSKYLFLITKCSNKELVKKLNEEYGKSRTHQFIVGYIIKKQIIDFDGSKCIRGPTYIFPFEKSVYVKEIFGKNFAQSENNGKTLSLVRNNFVNPSKTKEILENLPSPKCNVLKQCVFEIKKLDEKNKTCNKKVCIPKLMDKCLRR